MSQLPYPETHWIAFNMSAYFIFILGGIAIIEGKREYYIIPAFFILGGVIFNSIAHVLLAIFTGGYFPGLITALIYLLLIPFILRYFRSIKIADHN